MSLVGDRIKEELKKKTKTKVKKILTGVGPTLFFVIICVGVLYALISLVTGIISQVFSPFTNKYQKDAAYTQISSYGGAYKALTDGILDLEENGANYATIYQAFSYEAASYDSVGSYITIPDISVDDYEAYADNANTGNKDVSGSQATSKIDWNMSSFTYQYRTHWQYLLAIATVKQFEDNDAMEKQIELVADNLDEDGKVKNADKIAYNLVSSDDIEEVYNALADAGMETKVNYFTPYISDEIYKWVFNDGIGGVDFTTSKGLTSNSSRSTIGPVSYLYALQYKFKESDQTQIDSSPSSNFPYSAYCYPAWNNTPRTSGGTYRGAKDRYMAGTGNIASNMTYSSDYTYLSNNPYDRGDLKGDYSYVYYDGKVYPVCLVKDASNWLCKWSDFEYVKVKDDEKNTHYELVSYKKTYRIEELEKVWEKMGIDKSLYDFIFEIMNQIESIVGGNTSAEFSKAYSYYYESGEELSFTYKNPSYYQGTINEDDKEFRNSAAYAKVLSSTATSGGNLTQDLMDIYNSQDLDYQPSVKTGVETANVLYNDRMCYQPPHYQTGSTTDYDVYGFFAGLWSNAKGHSYYSPKITVAGNQIEGFGTDVRDSYGATANGFALNEKLGLCGSGFVNFILKMSIMQHTADLNSKSGNPYPGKTAVSMKDIYDSSNYKFTNTSELVIGDIGLLSLSWGSDLFEDEENNVIGYYAGLEGGKHIFYALISPKNPYSEAYNGSDSNTGTSYVQKIALEDSSKYTKVELKYFCRYYYGHTRENGNASSLGHVKAVKEYSGIGGSAAMLQMYNIYVNVKTMISGYVDSTAIKNSASNTFANCDISRQDEIVQMLMQQSPYLYGDRTEEVYRHVTAGVLQNGQGDDGYCGIDFDEERYKSTYQKLTDGDMKLPIHLEDGMYGVITSWYGWRDYPLSDVHQDEFHKGMDLWASTGESTPLYALTGGTVYAIGLNPSDSRGMYIIIDYGEGVKSTYMHMCRVLVSEGDVVDSNTIVGYMGTTGASTGVHCHLQLSDGEVHEGTELYTHPEYGGRPDDNYACKETVDPYLYFPELDDWPLTGDLEGTRPDISRDDSD